MGQFGSWNEAKGSTSIPIFDRHPLFFRYAREVFTDTGFLVGRIAASQATGHRAKMAVLPPMSLSPRYEGGDWLPSLLVDRIGPVWLIQRFVAWQSDSSSLPQTR